MPKISYFLLVLFSGLLFFPGIAKLPVIDRDEAHFAQASRQMLQNEQYFQIRFQEKTRFQKPPGINWLQAASVRLFSDADKTSIWPYRLPSVLGAMLSVLMTFFFARRFVSKRTALLSAAFLATSMLLVIEAHMAVIDASLLLSVVLMQGALWIIYQAAMDNKPVSWHWPFLFWLAMAVGFALKGVTPLVGCLSVLTLCIIERRIGWLKELRLISGFIFFLILSLAWLLMVNAAENSNYLVQMLHKDLLPKLKGGHESHGKPPLFHLAILPLTLWPASLFLWQGMCFAFSERKTTIVKFLLAWIVPVWVFFELMPTKLPQYVLPTFPAIAILCALAVTTDYAKNKPGKWLHCLQALWILLSLCLAAVLLTLPYLLLHQLTFTAVFLFVFLCLMSFVAGYLAWLGAYRRASVAVLLMAVIAYPVIFSGLLPSLEPLWISRNVALKIPKETLSEDNPLWVVGYAEPSLVFYLNTKKVRFTEMDNALDILHQQQDAYVLIERSKFFKMPKRGIEIVSHAHGYNYSKGKTVKLLLIKKHTQEESE